MAGKIKKNWLRLAGTLLVAFSAIAPAVAEAATSQPRDCDANAMTFCGAYSKAEFDRKLQNGDTRNSAANLQKIYLHEGLGFSKSDFDSSSTVDGTVFKDGRVVINQNFGQFKAGDLVGTNAVSDGRTRMPGSVQRGSVWERPTQTSFVASSIPAFINMNGGTMQWFVIKSCGNFGHGKPVVPKKQPVPGTFECVKLTVSQPDKDNKPSTFDFTIQPHVTGNVKLTGFRFNFSDIGTRDTAANKTTFERDLTPGSYNVSGQVKTSAGITAEKNACSATVVVNQQKVVKVVTVDQPVETTTVEQQPQVLSASTTPTTLVQTGPETALGGVAGLTAIGYASRAYLRSKKSLLDSLRNRNRDQ